MFHRDVSSNGPTLREQIRSHDSGQISRRTPQGSIELIHNVSSLVHAASIHPERGVRLTSDWRPIGPPASACIGVYPGIIGYIPDVYPIRWIRPEYILDVYSHQSSHGRRAAKPLKTCVHIVAIFPVDKKLNFILFVNWVPVDKKSNFIIFVNWSSEGGASRAHKMIFCQLGFVNWDLSTEICQLVCVYARVFLGITIRKASCGKNQVL